MKNFIPCLSIILLLCTAGLHAQQGNYRRILVQAPADSIQQWMRRELLPAHFHYRNEVLELELNTTEFKAFAASGIIYRDISDSFYRQAPVTVDPVTSRQSNILSAPAHFSVGSMAGYHTYDEAMAVLDEMRARFPALVSARDTIGFTYEGRPIIAVRISDQPDTDELNEDEWLMTALHHANEVLGEEVVFYFAWYLLEHYDTDKEIRTLLNNSALYIIPVVNPDGLAWNESTHPTGGGDWRKNRKPRVISSTTHYGVDLNRNYGYRWAYTHAGQMGQAGSNFAGNDYYRGTAAWSEAETQAMRNFCNSRRFTAAFNYHAWDNSFNYPWNYDVNLLTPDMVKYNAITQYCIEDNHFETGTFNTTLGYSANGTSDDWLYGEQTTKNKIFAFTIEVGKQFWPVPSLIPVYGDSLLQANLKMLRMAAKYAAIEETSNDTIGSLSAFITYDIKRYSIKDTQFTVSITPLDPEVFSTDLPKVYTSLDFLGTRTDTLGYLLSSTVTNGTVIRFELKVDNGAWYTIDTISKVFYTYSLPLDTTGHNKPSLPIGYDRNNKTFSAMLYPVPASNSVSLAITSPVPQNLLWRITDNAGRLCLSGKRSVSRGLSEQPVNISQLPKGVYMLVITPQVGNAITLKLLKE